MDALPGQKKDDKLGFDENNDDQEDDVFEDNSLVAVEGNGEVTFYLMEDGRLFCSGNSEYGLLGRGEKGVSCDVVNYESNTR